MSTSEQFEYKKFGSVLIGFATDISQEWQSRLPEVASGVEKGVRPFLPSPPALLEWEIYVRVTKGDGESINIEFVNLRPTLPQVTESAKALLIKPPADAMAMWESTKKLAEEQHRLMGDAMRYMEQEKAQVQNAQKQAETWAKQFKLPGDRKPH